MNIKQIFQKLFGYKPKLELNRYDSLIGEGTAFTGTIVYDSTLRVDGTLNGTISPRGSVNDRKTHTIIVTGGGEINCDSIVADFVIVNGTVRGNIKALCELHVGSTALIEGDCTYDSLTIAQGAKVNGRLLQATTPQKPTVQAKDAEISVENLTESLATA
jgi:cytoskeletal protein CcmA (bactofilin family)